MAFTELIPMKRSQKQPCEGDVFILQPQPGVYLFGKVVKANLKSRDSFINGMSLIYIYDVISSDKKAPESLDQHDLLIPPLVVNNQPWIKGYFETVGSSVVTEKERDLDYGFWDIFRRRFVNYGGEELGRQPTIWSEFGLGSYGVVGRRVQVELAKRSQGC